MTAGRRPAAGGFDRIPPRRSRAATADPEGRAALFSDPQGAVDDRPEVRRPGLTVSCRTCRTVSPISPVGLAFALFPVTMVLPWRPNWLLGTCPACRRRAWLALGWRW